MGRVDVGLVYYVVRGGGGDGGAMATFWTIFDLPSCAFLGPSLTVRISTRGFSGTVFCEERGDGLISTNSFGFDHIVLAELRNK